MLVRSLYLVIVLLATTVAVLVVGNSGLAKEPSIRIQSPTVQSKGRRDRERFGNFDGQIVENANEFVEEGRNTFRSDTFGDEVFWGGALQLHQAIKGATLGGVGPGISPRTALILGLKVDVDALPQPLINQIRQGRINLDDPAVTIALLRLDAVVGLKGFFQGNDLNSTGWLGQP
jgi:hypothetical protein